MNQMDARSSYRETAARGATPVQLVVLLYEQCIEDLRRAIVALKKNDVETRTQRINHALLVIAQLQASLDMDRGGIVAQNLERFYRSVRRGLVEAQAQQSMKALEEQISHVMLVREAWAELEQSTTWRSTGQQGSERESNQARGSFAEWNA